MTSKTFKSVLGTTELELSEYAESRAGLFVSDEDGEELSGFYFDQSTAPALALAILEAAGVEAKSHEAATVPYGTPAHLGMIASHLKAYAEAKSMNDAEAKDQAELEAEALELLNASLASCDLGQVELFEALNPLEQQRWLAVARKSRELRAEK